MPSWMTSDRLTLIGLAGAIIICARYAWAGWNPAALWLAFIGLVINWFGDSLDGSLARHRKIERPKCGYFLDNAVDVAQQFLVTVGIGLSGFIRWDLCFLALSALLMMSALTILRAEVASVYQLAYGGIGPNEMRIVGIVLNAAVFFVPPEQFAGLRLPMTYPNILLLTWSCPTLVMFTLSLWKQIRELAIEAPS